MIDREISADQADVVLALALHGGGRLIDLLIARLERPDGATWIDAVLTKLSSSERAALFDGGDFDACVAVKEQGKRLIAADDDAEQMRGLALYAIGGAACLAHHGQLPTSQSADEWSDLLADLAAVTAGQLRELVERAASLESE